MNNNSDLKKSLEIRQENLIFLLKNKKDHLQLEKQHQIYGAIKEIDYILRMMRYSTEEDEETNKPSTVLTSSLNGTDSLVNSRMKTKTTIKLSERVKKLKIPFKIRFQRDEL